VVFTVAFLETQKCRYAGWEVKAGMTCLQVKLCVAISERFGKYVSYLKALYKCPGLLFHFTLFTARRSYASAVLGVVILSVRPSVRLSVCLSVRHTRAL